MTSERRMVMVDVCVDEMWKYQGYTYNGGILDYHFTITWIAAKNHGYSFMLPSKLTIPELPSQLVAGQGSPSQWPLVSCITNI